MNDEDKLDRQDQDSQQDELALRPFDPFEEHFVSQNTKNDFLKALETKPPAE